MKEFSCKNIELSGSNLIQASAGTGKTYSIALLFLKMVLSGIKADSILTVTFTQAATAELKNRIGSFLKIAQSYIKNDKCSQEYKNIKEMIDLYKNSIGAEIVKERIILAGRNFDNVSIFTIHGFCKRIISENAFETGTLFKMDISADIEDQITGAVEAFWRREIQKIPANVLEQISSSEWFSIEKITNMIKGRRNVQDLTVLPESKIKVPSWKEEKVFFNEENESVTDCNDLIILFKILLEEVNRHLETEREKAGVMGFDDLLIVLSNSLKDPKKREVLINAMKKKYQAVLIDEFQDTDALQYNIFKTLFENDHHILFFIGDPKQAIYSFRNADVFAYLKAKESVAKEKRFTMNSNFRSSKRAVNAVSALFNSENSFENSDIEFPHVVSAAEGENALQYKNEPVFGLEIKFLRSDKAESFELSGNKTWKNRKLKHEPAKNKAIADMCAEIIKMIDSSSEYRIVKEKGSEKIKPSDIAILVNSNNDAELVKNAFSKYEIPFVMASNASIFESEEAIDVETVLEAFSDFSSGRIKAALLTMFFGESLNKIDKLSDDSSEMEGWLDFFSNLNEVWEKHGFLVSFSAFLESKNIYERIAAGKTGERRLTNVRHLMELIHRFEKENTSSTESTLRWLKEKMIEKSTAEEEQLRLESDDNAVSITTVHKSKGLTFPIVFCPDLWRKAQIKKDFFLFYHDGSNNPVINFDTEDPTARTEYLTEALSENLRLVYVALTRARYLTVVYWGNIYGMGSTPFSKLFHRIKNDNEFRNMSDIGLLKTLAEIEKNSDNSIKVSDNITSPQKSLTLENEPVRKKDQKKLVRKVVSDWNISSFSSIASHGSGKEVDNDYLFEKKENIIPEQSNIEKKGILFFPAGVKAGTALHAVFEKIDFQKSDNDEIISEVLNTYNIRYSEDGTDMTPWVSECVNSTLDAPVFNGRSLRDVKKESVVSEMEFFIPSQNFDSHKVVEIIGDIVSIPDNSFSGFLHGFMDLVFKLDGKYYLIDWKSNRLGESIEDYDNRSMKKEMKKHNYVLQYSLYLSALDIYLQKKDKNYNYDDNFGGVYYIFLRGVTASNNYATGIYEDKPEKNVLDRLKMIFNGKQQ